MALQCPELRVTVVDKDQDRIMRWHSRHLPIYEPDLDNIVRVARDGTLSTSLVLDKMRGAEVVFPRRTPNLFFSWDMASSVSDADIVFLSVDTPAQNANGDTTGPTNLTRLKSAVESVALAAKAGVIIAEKSTVPCGTAKTIRDIVC